MLQKQVRGLQKEMLERMEKVQAVSDEKFAQQFRVIVACVKSLSRSVRTTPDADVFKSLEPRKMLLDTKKRHWKIRAHHKFYIEAWVWSVLIELVFATPFSIFGKVGSALANNWTFVYGLAHRCGQPTPSASSESYRYTLTNELVSLIDRETISKGERKTYVRNKTAARHIAQGVLEC
ncbi:hypothetical protein OPT61_g4674 [Boeremia exigua]|uniref:Uncharacterized protein n=1 Tax=Boeremia exigua TaxID=749465 RepID=A0ACC2ID99_9PLEO|nr:hypothetical protein OPT61_g4674 [Boeremia exigua]